MTYDAEPATPAAGSNGNRPTMPFTSKPSEPIRQLLAGIKAFRAQYYERRPDSMRQLVTEGQHPEVLVIGCSDSRVDPALLTMAEPGELFVVRNVANLVPPYQPDGAYHGTSAAIEYAVRALKVSEIIVLGHAQCGGIRALMERPARADGEPDYLNRWMDIAEPARQRVLSDMPAASLAEHRRACEQASILISLRNLEALPCVQRRLQAGDLTLHGWYFDLVAGALLAYSARADAFLPIVCPLFTEPS